MCIIDRAAGQQEQTDTGRGQQGVQYFIRIWNAADVYAGSRRVHERALSGDFEKSCASDVGRALKVLRR